MVLALTVVCHNLCALKTCKDVFAFFLVHTKLRGLVKRREMLSFSSQRRFSKKRFGQIHALFTINCMIELCGYFR